MATEIFLFAKNVTPDSCEGCIDFYATLNPRARALLKMGFALSSLPRTPWPLGFNLNLFHLGLFLSWVISSHACHLIYWWQWASWSHFLGCWVWPPWTSTCTHTQWFFWRQFFFSLFSQKIWENLGISILKEYIWLILPHFLYHEFWEKSPVHTMVITPKLI